MSEMCDMKSCLLQWTVQLLVLEVLDEGKSRGRKYWFEW